MRKNIDIKEALSTQTGKIAGIIGLATIGHIRIFSHLLSTVTRAGNTGGRGAARRSHGAT